MKATTVVYILYVAGSLCFLAGSLLSLMIERSGTR